MKNINLNKIIRRVYILFFTLSLTVFYTNCGRSAFKVSSAPLSDDELASLSNPDPLLAYQWHLINTGQPVFSKARPTNGIDINLKETWNSGVFGSGVKVLISDDGVQSGHEDLTANYLFGNMSKNYSLASPYIDNTAEPLLSSDKHGTSVAGLIAAIAGNYKGGRGVASSAQVACANYLSDAVASVRDAVGTKAILLSDQAKGDFDVYNQSWGVGKQQSVYAIDSTYTTQLLNGVTNYRSGKGSVYVRSAGNSFFLVTDRVTTAYRLGNANFDSNSITPYTVNVAALAASGTAASYSSPGSNIWISAPGGEDGVTNPAITTTDLSGCSSGYAISNTSSTLKFQKGQSGNSNCNYTATFNGTSSAAPIISGAVALILSANPNLTWREVKYILAKTAKKNHASMTSFENPLYTQVSATAYADHKSPTGYIYEQSWVTNSAGFHFHNWYGFGLVDVDAAVAMAKNFSTNIGAYYESNWNASDKRTVSLAIPDYSAAGVTDTMTVSTNVKIEALQIKLNITHANIGELAIELTSPSGTKNIVMNMNSALDGISNYSGQVLLTNAFYQESSVGTWTLRVVDGRTGVTGTLTDWSLNFVGGQ